jgi:hypothetical protein
MIMADAMLHFMAQCTKKACGWIGPAHERTVLEDTTEDLYCPRCHSLTRSWLIDQAKEQASLDALQAEWSRSRQVPLDAFRQSREAKERLSEAKAHVKRLSARLALAEVNAPGDTQRQLQLKQALLKAEGQEAEAAVACAQAVAKVRALG